MYKKELKEHTAIIVSFLEPGQAVNLVTTRVAVWLCQGRNSFRGKKVGNPFIPGVINVIITVSHLHIS
jgi:hypothetical protein